MPKIEIKALKPEALGKSVGRHPVVFREPMPAFVARQECLEKAPQNG